MTPTDFDSEELQTLIKSMGEIWKSKLERYPLSEALAMIYLEGLSNGIAIAEFEFKQRGV